MSTKRETYSITNYRALGFDCGQLGGKPLAEQFQARIFTPPGMHHTSLPPLTSAALSDPHPQGYTSKASGECPDAQARAQVNRLCNVTDMAFRGAGRLGRPGAEYRLGTIAIDGFLGHTGSLPGFQSFTGYRPEQNQLVIVLTNLDQGTNCSASINGGAPVCPSPPTTLRRSLSKTCSSEAERRP